MSRFGLALLRAPRAALALVVATAFLGALAISFGQAPARKSAADAAVDQSPAAISSLPASPGASIVADPIASSGGDVFTAYVAAMMEEGAIEEPPASALPPVDRHAAAIDGRFAMPLKAWTTFTDRYGAPRGKGWIHGGIDLSLETYHHSEVFAACNGTVAAAEYLRSYGNHVIVDCGDGWSTLYGHLSSIGVKAGQAVTYDTVIGISGSTGFSTGEHLHFEIRWQGTPVNPEAYLDFNIPADAPLSNGPIWFGDPGGRARSVTTGRPSTPAATTSGADSRAAAPTATRPAPTPTPPRPASTPTRVATPTPKPDR